ncbi:MAG: methyltransferase domain-containing protein, partial [Nanoarchaeota archaeon]
LVRIYFRMKVWLAIRLAKLKKDDVILDFGCGGGWLEKKLQGYRIYGYDINPKKTFIKNYKKIKADKIFVLDVFEHVQKEEIKKILNNFKKLNKKFDLIVSIPTENFASRKVRKFVGKVEIPREHITKYKDILEILKKNFKLKKRVNLFTVSHIFLFEHKK